MIAAAVLVAAAPSASPAQRPPERTGECRILRGRAFLSNGTPSVRLWVIGTTRILGVHQQDLSFDDLPSALRQAWTTDGRPDWGKRIYGRFTVCALEPSRPGRMQEVRIVAAGDLRVRRY